MSMMKYKVEFKHHEAYLEAIVSGELVGMDDMMAYSGEVLKVASENNYHRVLIDELEASMNLSELDQHELMNFYLNDFPKSLNIRFSAIYNKHNEKEATFFGGLAQQVGFDCVFFLEKAAGINYLLEYKP